MEPDADPRSSLPWLRPDWRASADSWIVDQVGRLGLALTGPIEQPHVYWWSTALRVPTDGGVLWFKASQPDGAFETGLTPVLGMVRPSETADILVADIRRGWMLTRDAGTRLRVVGGDVLPVDHWAALLPRYAELQIDLVGRSEELLAIGVPDLRLATLPGELAAALDEPDLLLLDTPAGLSGGDRERLVSDLPEFAGRCERLASFGIPETLQHDDLHDGNVFVRDGRYVFFDWGDSCISHPFHTLVVTLRALAHRHAWVPGGPEVVRLRDAYLEPWTRFGSMAELVTASGLALQTGTIQRALRWRRGILAMPPAVRAEHVESVPYGLRLYLLDGPFGTWDVDAH